MEHGSHHKLAMALAIAILWLPGIAKQYGWVISPLDCPNTPRTTPSCAQTPNAVAFVKGCATATARA
eukprot:14017322-Alexandrium_andersonii.AAC.1